MKRLFVDTNAWTALVSGNQKIADVLGGAEAICLNPVVIGQPRGSSSIPRRVASSTGPG